MDIKDKIDDFLDLPWYYRLASGVFALVLVVGSYYFFYLSPMYEEISGLEARSVDLQKEIQALRIKASRLPEFQAEVDRLDIELAKALRELPDKKEIDTLLARISEKAKDAGLDVILFKPESEQKKDFYAEVPVSLEVRGGFHQVASFFDEVAHMERIVNMTQFRIQVDSHDSWETLKTNVIATSFRFLDESERPREEDKKSKKRRRR
jgi:type IV pilus assembly protein PilO